MTRTLLMTAVAALALGAGSTAFAQDATMDASTMTCADFTALTADDQATAYTELETARIKSTPGAQTDEESAAAAAGEGSNMAADTDAGSDEATAATESGDSDTDTAADMADPAVEALIGACAGQDDMLAMDALPSEM